MGFPDICALKNLLLKTRIVQRIQNWFQACRKIKAFFPDRFHILVKHKLSRTRRLQFLPSVIQNHPPHTDRQLRLIGVGVLEKVFDIGICPFFFWPIAKRFWKFLQKAIHLRRILPGGNFLIRTVKCDFQSQRYFGWRTFYRTKISAPAALPLYSCNGGRASAVRAPEC